MTILQKLLPSGDAHVARGWHRFGHGNQAVRYTEAWEHENFAEEQARLDKAFQQQVRDYLQPGTSPLFMVIEHVTPDKATAAVQQYGGTVIRTSLSEEDTKSSRKRCSLRRRAAVHRTSAISLCGSACSWPALHARSKRGIRGGSSYAQASPCR